MPAAHAPVRLAVMDEFLRSESEIGSFPSAVYAIGSPDGIEREGAVGCAVAVPIRIPASLDTIYDCASLTKPLVTTTLILQAVASGAISLDTQFEGFTYRELLTHTTGLKAWLPLYAHDDYLDAIRREGHEYERGKKVVYASCERGVPYYTARDATKFGCFK